MLAGNGILIVENFDGLPRCGPRTAAPPMCVARVPASATTRLGRRARIAAGGRSDETSPKTKVTTRRWARPAARMRRVPLDAAVASLPGPARDESATGARL